MIEISVKVGGKAMVKISGEDTKKVFEEASFFSSLPNCCPRCKRESQQAVEYKFVHNSDKDGNHYYKLRCDKGHQSSLGQHRAGGALFYKHGESWQTYEEIKGGKNTGTSNTSKSNQPPDMPEPPADAYDDDLPF